MPQSFAGTTWLPLAPQRTHISPGYYNCGGTILDADMMLFMVTSAMVRNIDISDLLNTARFIPDPHEVPYQTFGGLWR